MNDATETQDPDEMAEPQEAAVSAGTLLRRAREASGLHVAALAVSLKVPVRKLEALEGDRIDDLGDAVFVRGLASSVCRSLKIDPGPVLERLPQTTTPRLIKDTDGLRAPFHAPSDGPAPTWVDRIREPVPAAVIALLIGAVVVYFLPGVHPGDKSEESSVTSPVQALVKQAVNAAPSFSTDTTANETPAKAPASIPASASASAPALVSSPPALSAPVLASAPAVADTKEIAPPASAVSPASGIVVIRTKGESWVEVVDAKGVVTLRKLMGAGDAVGANGPLPLTVTIGKADVTDVEVRGKKFDMRPVSKDNVARFEVR